MGSLSQGFGWSWWDVIGPDALSIVELAFEIGGIVLAAIGRNKATVPVKLLP